MLYKRLLLLLSIPIHHPHQKDPSDLEHHLDLRHPPIKGGFLNKTDHFLNLCSVISGSLFGTWIVAAQGI